MDYKQVPGWSDYWVREDGQVLCTKFCRGSHIRVVNSFVCANGYAYFNATEGGRRKKVSVHRAVCEAFHRNPKSKETVNHIDGNRQNNHKDNLEWNTHKENHQHAIENLRPKMTRPEKTPVQMFSKEGEFIKEFPSLASACRETGVDKGNLRIACQQGLVRKGFKWKYADEDLVPTPEKNTGGPPSKPCNQFLDGELVGSFRSVKEAANEVGSASSSISNAVRTGQKCKGFQWGYGDKPKAPNGKASGDAHHAARTIQQCDLDGNVIAEFGSIAQASKETGINAGTISWARQKQKTGKGYYWRNSE